MRYAFDIDWGLAGRVADLGGGRLPAVSRREAAEAVAGIKLAAREAAELAAETVGLPTARVTVRVVDRATWARAAAGIAESVFAGLGWPQRPDGMVRRTSRVLLGGLLGGGLAVAGRWLLGQYDAYTGSRALYLIAPNLVGLERAHGFEPRHFRRWVAAHEHTHALQFAHADWLAGHITGLVRADEPGTVDRLVGAMSFLEGHADFVADRCPIPDVARMRAAFARGHRRAGLIGKSGQYRQGLAFCEAVAGVGGERAPLRALASPWHLPRRSELADPLAWWGRVNG